MSLCLELVGYRYYRMHSIIVSATYVVTVVTWIKQIDMSLQSSLQFLRWMLKQLQNVDHAAQNAFVNTGK